VITLLLPLLLAATPEAGSPTPVADPPAEFIDAVLPLYKVVTCQKDPLPAGLEQKAVDAYCAIQKPRFETYRQHWGTTARDFLAKLRPAKLPAELVYPFGGGDLMSALTAFPDATTITTLSLELAGDPRRLPTVTDPKVLKESLLAVANASASTLVSGDSLSKNLSKVQRGELPGQLSMHLIGLGLFDLEPVSVRFFRVEPDGSLHYFTLPEVKALESEKASSLKADWKSPDFSPAFANVEVQFVPRGHPESPRRVHRHIGADLSNDGVTTKAPGVLAHLIAKGKVAAMTKAASYLLWNANFSIVRDYLVSHAVYMVSDSTGVPPRFWKKAGCALETFGSFEKSFLPASSTYEAEFHTAFEHAKRVPMRFGYPDASPEKRSHLVVVRCEGDATDAGK
jgi:hypothetical protein